MIILKCKSCPHYDRKNNKQRNKLKCMFSCVNYIQEQKARAFQYNASVSTDIFENETEYEHGKKVFGSGMRLKDGKE